MEWILEPRVIPNPPDGGCGNYNKPCGILICSGVYTCHHCSSH